MKTLDQMCVDTIRFLAVDAVEKAKSGHPGMPLGAAPMAFALWDRHLRHHPANPQWCDRDRFVLSAGHGSMLLYALLHLYGYDLPLDELKNFRQWGSKTPGHPEYGRTPGVECTTGPLGQGFAMGVGMAVAEKHLGGVFNDGSTKESLVDHYTYAIVSDGDLMEGVACEAASLAGTLKLGKLIYLYDDNRITIEGSTDLAFTENVDARFAALGWHVQYVDDGNDVDAIDAAIAAAKKETHKPSLIRVHTHIGFGSPKQDSEKSHGEPLGSDATRATKETLDWAMDPLFHVPDDVRVHCAGAVERGAALEAGWQETMTAFRRVQKDKAELFARLIAGELPEGWSDAIPTFDAAGKAMATRSASGQVLNAIAAGIPTMIGGSADLAGSNKSEIDAGGDFALAAGSTGRNLHFGVREHAMGAIVNGMALHGGVVPYGATFLIFSDYMRPALRLAALMKVRSIFVYTHDSIGLGEDGPTHQPIEQLMTLRAIPGFTLFRPADANETAAAWRLAIARKGPSALALTRQNLPVLDDSDGRVTRGVACGAYVLSESAGGDACVVLVATGSEVQLALAAQTVLSSRDVSASVVSIPSWEVFLEQPESYRDSILPRALPKLVIEAGRTMGWRDLIGDNGDVIGIDRFGESAPGEVVMDKLGFSVDHIVARTLRLVSPPCTTPR